jgi:hypothetical protein
MLWFNGKPKINESYIDKNTYIVEKYLNLFVRALETGRKSILCWAFLPCFEASANELYIFRQCTYIVFIMQCKKKPKATWYFAFDQRESEVNLHKATSSPE